MAGTPTKTGGGQAVATVEDVENPRVLRGGLTEAEENME